LRAGVAKGVEPGVHRTGHGAGPRAGLQTVARQRAGAAAIRNALHRLNRASGALRADLSRRASDAATDPGTGRRRARSPVDDPNAVCAVGGGSPHAGAVLVEAALPIARTAGLRRHGRTRRRDRPARTAASGATGSAAPSGTSRSGGARRSTTPTAARARRSCGAVLRAAPRTTTSDNQQRETCRNEVNRTTQMTPHF